MRWAAVVVLGLAVSAGAAPPRFFIMGTGTLAVTNTHTGEHLRVRYRNPDNTYDAKALARVNHLFRSKDGATIEMSLRLIEILSHLQNVAGVKELVLQSGYRSPRYNQGLRDEGRKVAGWSLHTEGLAADIAFPRRQLAGLWQKARGLECCGAGYYAEQGFLHIDVGPARFWEAATSRVDENLSAGNARMFARTEFDRYEEGEAPVVALHAVSFPPVLIARQVVLIDERGDREEATLRRDSGNRSDCLEVTETGAGFHVERPISNGRRRVVLTICEPHAESTPGTLRTNYVDIR